jgi:DNA-binding Lrp family transcriptional regulator
MPLAGAALLLSAAAAEPDYADSYRLIARELGLSKNTVLEIVKRNPAKSA